MGRCPLFSTRQVRLQQHDSGLDDISTSRQHTDDRRQQLSQGGPMSEGQSAVPADGRERLTAKDAIEGNGETDPRPLVTVVITTYNRPSYLTTAVRSVRDQTYDPIELIVVDDHSDTPASRSLADVPFDRFANVECIRHDENRGANAARNTGIEAASGEYIAFLDDDDSWLPTKVERQVDTFQRHGDIGVTYTGLILRNGQDAEIAVPPTVEDMTKALLCRNVVGTLSTVMVRADLAREVTFDEEFPSWADLEWYISLSTSATFQPIPDPLVVYEFDSHNRLSEDLPKKQDAYHLFLERFDDLAAEFGPLFRRKMRAWAAYRLGATAIDMRRYGESRRLFGTAVRRYPFEPQFLKYFLASLGGRYTVTLARGVKRALADLSSP